MPSLWPYRRKKGLGLMAPVFPKMVPMEFSGAPLGRLVILEVRQSVEMAVVVGKGDDKFLFYLAPKDAAYFVQKAPADKEMLLVDHDVRISIDTDSMSRISGFYEPDSLGFLLTVSDGSSAIICSEYDGFGRENALVRIHDWQVSGERPKVRLGSRKWQIEILDEASGSWKSLYSRSSSPLAHE